MKFALSRLKIGQELVAQVSECLPNGDIIVAYGGDLVRVKNQTSRCFFAGDSITLRVSSINPIGFQYVIKPRRNSLKIDVSV